MTQSRFSAAVVTVVMVITTARAQAQTAATPSKSAATNGSAKALVVAEGLDRP